MRYIKKYILIILFVVWIMPVSTSIFATSTNPPGDGTANNPWQLYTAEHLVWINGDSDRLSGHFILMNDIVAPVNFTIGADICNEIMISDGRFTGNFNGNDYTIKIDITITMANDPLVRARVGLFNRVGADGVIRNLRVEGVIISQSTAGGIAGYVENGGIIENSSFIGNIDGPSNNNIGGLAGNLHGIIRNSYFIGSINANANIGGLVGVVFPSGRLENSHAIATINANNMVGGVTGNAQGTITGNRSIAQNASGNPILAIGFNHPSMSTITWPIIFDLAGGNLNGSAAMVIHDIPHYGQSNITPPTPIRTDHTFVGWNPPSGWNSNNVVNGLLINAMWECIMCGYYPCICGIPDPDPDPDPNPDPTPDPDPTPSPTPPTPAPPGTGTADPDPYTTTPPTPRTIPANNNAIRLPITSTNNRITLITTNLTNNLINSAVNNNIIFDLSRYRSITSATLPTSTVRQFANAELGLTVIFRNGTRHFNAQEVAELAQQSRGRNIIISLETITYEIYEEEYEPYEYSPAEPPQALLRFAINQYQYTHNGQIFISEAAPFIYHDRTMVPLRIIAEALGADVGWDGDTRIVSISLDGMTLHLAVDETLPDGMGVPIIRQGRTLVPVRYVSETLGAYVRWDRDNLAVYVYGG